MTDAIAANPAVRAIGVALIWFVLQGAIAAAVVAGLLVAARRASANLRYLIACVGLAAMALMPVVTAARLWSAAPARAVDAAGDSRHQAVAIGSDVPLAAEDPGWRVRLAPDRVAPVVVGAWITGVLALTIRLLGGWLQIVRIRRSATRPDEAEWSGTVARLGQHLGLTRAVRLLESALVGVPVVIGWMRPMILVPAGAFAGLAPDQVEAILAHELAHIRRGDYIVNAWQRVVEIVLFYHPAVWWVSGCIRREREHCCDDLAAPLAASPLTYAHALVALEARRRRAPALAMAATGSRLFARVRRIVDPSSAVDTTFSKGTVMTIVSSVVALVVTGAMSVGHASPVSSPGGAHATQESPRGVQAPVPGQTPVADSDPIASSGRVDTPAVPVQGRGSIRGIVSDQRRGRIPGAMITVDTIGREGASRTVTSGATGEFTVAGLPDGAYLLTVRLPGFVREERRVDVAAGAELTENVQLRIGSKEETLTIFGSSKAGVGGEMPSAPRQASTASVAGLLDAAKQAADAGRLAEAEASLRDAIAILHAAQPRAQVPAPTGAVRIGGDIKEPKKILDVAPVYPAAARAAGIQGVVIIEATINPDGTVADANVLRGVPELNDAALDAVRQWAYTPTLLGGQPVSVLMTVTVVFSLK